MASLLASQNGKVGLSAELGGVRRIYLGLFVFILAGCADPPPATSSAISAPPAGMVLVPAGEVPLGADDANAFFHPARRQFVPAFYLDKCEVTQAEFKRFDPSFEVEPGRENCPVTHVSKEKAEAYLASQGKRLPTAAEWEKAARGSDGRLYPWGNQWDHRRGNLTANGRAGGFCSLGRMKPVGSFPEGVSPYGCLDMCGNAWEWVADTRDGRPVIRGGAYGYRERDCRATGYATEDPGYT
jgi:formylglycine-generating enzyme required for sulfatase activity